MTVNNSTDLKFAMYPTKADIPQGREITEYIKDGDDETAPIPGETLLWSGRDPKHIPALHSILTDCHLLGSEHLVIGYFEEAGFFGLVTLPFNAPEWWLRQGPEGRRDGSDYSLLFGVDLSDANPNTLDGTNNVDLHTCTVCLEEEVDFNLLVNDQHDAFDNVYAEDGETFRVCGDCQGMLLVFDDNSYVTIDDVEEHAMYPTVKTEDREQILLFEDHDQGEGICKSYWEDMMAHDPEEFCQLVGHDTIVALATGNQDREQFLNDLVNEDFGNRYYEGRMVMYCGTELESDLGFEPKVEYRQRVE